MSGLCRLAPQTSLGQVYHLVTFLEDSHGEQISDFLLLCSVAAVRCNEPGDFADGLKVGAAFT
jgi:hypothetical protein